MSTKTYCYLANVKGMDVLCDSPEAVVELAKFYANGAVPGGVSASTIPRPMPLPKQHSLPGVSVTKRKTKRTTPVLATNMTLEQQAKYGADQHALNDRHRRNRVITFLEGLVAAKGEYVLCDNLLEPMGLPPRSMQAILITLTKHDPRRRKKGESHLDFLAPKYFKQKYEGGKSYYGATKGTEELLAKFKAM